MTTVRRHSVALDPEVIAALDQMTRPGESRNEALRELLGMPPNPRRTVDPVEMDRLIRSGLSVSETAEAMDVDRRNIEYWINNDPELRQIVDEQIKQRREATREKARLANRDRHGHAGPRSEQVRAKARAKMNFWSDEELIAAMRRAGEELGEPLSSKKFKHWLPTQPDLPTIRTFAVRLGGGRWAVALERCGMKLSMRRKRVGPATIEEPECLAAVARVATVVGRIPTAEEYQDNKLPEEPSQATVRARAGSWSEVVRKLLDAGVSS